jgi:hypothetical protein
MYSIFRFTIDRTRLGELDEIGRDMNILTPKIYQGLRRAGDGFACDLSWSKSWRDHQKAATDFISLFQGHIRQALAIGALTAVDMALRGEDLSVPVKSVHFGANFLQVLASAGVDLEITVYTGASFQTEAEETGDSR